MKTEELLSRLSLEEKAYLCTGADAWHTVAVERLGIPSVVVSDGPHGLRRETGVSCESKPATCFPSGSALAASWDVKMMEELGRALSEECHAQGVSVLLGPAVNIKRSPLCGRNFEYYSEDPYLSSRIATAYINGVQSGGTGVSLKHFAANNKESGRLTTDTVVDERTLREIYLASFEATVKQAKPDTVMCAYNKLNGDYCSENKRLLTDILRGEWGFDGLVMSDWGAVSDRDKGIEAGLDLEMPGGYDIGPQKVIEAVKNGRLSEKALDKCVARVLKLAFKGQNADKQEADDTKISYKKHHELAKKIAEDCMVLLKNDEILPLKKSGKFAVIGAFAKHQRYQGGGSSHIYPTSLDSSFDEIKKTAPEAVVSYSAGYSLTDDEPDADLITKAVEAAMDADVAVIFAGLPDSYESEGFDRSHLRMPQSHTDLIEAVSKVQKNTVVVLSNGAPVEMPWIGSVKAVLEGYLCGQAAGGAQAAILFGDVNPSGKLAETFPKKLSDNPSYLNFPADRPNHVEYREGVFVGYRYYEKKELAPLFPFGYGLSYTTFEYRNIETDKSELQEDETLTVKVTVENTGSCFGKETVQLYVRDVESSVMRPIKELREFEKVSLDAGERKTVEFKLSKRAFAFYDTEISDWRVEDGQFEILAGGSSVATPLSALVTVHPNKPVRMVYTKQTTIAVLWENPEARKILRGFMEQNGISEKMLESNGAYDMPLRNIFMSGVKYTQEELDRFIDILNNV